jgi:hypothetical protein
MNGPEMVSFMLYSERCRWQRKYGQFEVHIILAASVTTDHMPVPVVIAHDLPTFPPAQFPLYDSLKDVSPGQPGNEVFNSGHEVFPRR